MAKMNYSSRCHISYLPQKHDGSYFLVGFCGNDIAELFQFRSMWWLVFDDLCCAFQEISKAKEFVADYVDKKGWNV